MAYALGVDVGTTSTAAAVWRDGRATPAALRPRQFDIPSVLYREESGTMLVGEAAVRASGGRSDRMARDFKRSLGTPGGRLRGIDVAAESLVADMIRFAVNRVGEGEEEPPAHVTLTCPAWWGPERQELMERSAGLAGLDSVGLVPEPVAAAVSYAARVQVDTDALLGVYDLGGGSFGATVLRKTPGGFEMCGRPAGLEDVGGAAFDQVVYAEVARSTGPALAGLRSDARAAARVARVRSQCVQAKEALSSVDEARFTAVLPPHFVTDVRVTRSAFEDAIRIPLLRTVSVFADTVQAAGVHPADLALVLLVGGSSQIPLVARLLEERLDVHVALDDRPELAVCLGAAITAGVRLRRSRVSPDTATVSPQIHRGAVRGARDDDRTAVRTHPTTEPHPTSRPASPGGGSDVPPPVIEVDRLASQISDLTDRRLRPHIAPHTHRLLADSETLYIRTGQDVGYGQEGRLFVLLVGLAVAVVLALIVLLAMVTH